MSADDPLLYHLGELTAEVRLINDQFIDFRDSVGSMFDKLETKIDTKISNFDIRLRATEKSIIELSVKVAMIGIIAGGAGSAIMTFILRKL